MPVSGGIDKPLGLLSSPILLFLYRATFHKTYAVTFPVFVVTGLIWDMFVDTDICAGFTYVFNK